MSKDKQPIAVMLPLAEKLLDKLRPFCARIEMAGSLRRRQPLIGDFEMVAVPIPAQISIGGEIHPPYLVTQFLADAADAGVSIVKNGPKYVQFVMTTAQGRRVQVDLFLQPDPATWGQNFLIRTGSADFSHWIVTPRSQGGAVPVDDGGRPLFYSRDARWHDARTHARLATPEECDVFELLGVPFVTPIQREVGYWQRNR
ncbi:MAG: hypothetical protein IAE79_17565 [Anaerolinea sp.]|nr:hypothetical protein [Anaerolinea sp.]